MFWGSFEGNPSELSEVFRWENHRTFSGSSMTSLTGRQKGEDFLKLSAGSKNWLLGGELPSQ